jgi:DNA-binding beta-propeller fold protein YncE/mono/diheme cytochrome c family protein
MRTLPAALFALLAVAAPGCAPEPPEPAAPRPLGHAARGGSLIIDHERLAAWAADADNHAIYRVDLVSEAVSRTPIDGAPEQIALVGGGRIAVTVRDRNRVELFDEGAEGELTQAASAEVAVDPFGLAVTPQGEILVTSAFSHTLSALDADSLELQWSIDTAREPRAVVVTEDGAQAFVTHLVGDSISIVDLAQPRPEARRSRVLGGLYRNRVDQSLGAGTLHPTASLAYAAVISESGSRLFVPHSIEQNGSSTTRSIPTAYGGVPVDEETSFASVAVVRTRDGRALGDGAFAGAPMGVLEKTAFIAPDPSVDFAVAPISAPCRQGRAVAVAGDRLLVASQGTNEIVELDARALDPAMRAVKRYPVGEGPKGVDADARLGVAVAWDQLSHDVAIVSLGSGAVTRIPIASDPLPPEIAAGRRLFVTELDRRITRDGRACAGCHPEGRDDAVVWKLGAGPRQTPTLVGRLDRGPYGWLGKHPTLEGNMSETISRLGGTGLPDADLRRLAAFLKKGLAAPARPASGRADGALAARGKAIFTSETAGCSGCHKLDMEASDRLFHTVGSRGKDDTTDGFRTPPLIFVGSTAPYFHDGRYATLEQLLNDNLDRMGQTTQLSDRDVEALAAYLRTL